MRHPATVLLSFVTAMKNNVKTWIFIDFLKTLYKQRSVKLCDHKYKEVSMTKKIRAGLVVCGILLSALLPAQADSFTDGFDRADTASPDGGLGSADYTMVGDFYLSGGAAVHDNNAQTVIGVYTGGELGSSWTNTVDAMALSSGTISGSRYIGAVWNYQNSTNYYVFRVQVKESGAYWQFLEYNDGVAKTYDAAEVGSALSLDTTYTISVESTGTDGTFAVSLMDGSTPIVNETVSDQNGSATLTDGYAGFYSSNTHSEFDNLELAGVVAPVEPDPSVLFFDDYDRADTPSPDGGLDSTDYDMIGDVYLSAETAVHDNNAQTVMGVYTGSELGSNWKFSVDATALSSGSITGNRYIGLVWNYQNPTNYYVFRVQVLETGAKWQFIEYNDGTSRAYTAVEVGSALSLDTAYTISIETTDTDGTFAFAVLDGSSNIVSGTVSDPDGYATLTGGYVGFYSNNTHSEFDNFELSAVVPPTQIMSIEPYTADVMKIVAYSATPQNIFLKCKTNLTDAAWVSVGHSTNGIAPFVVTNLSYSAADSDNCVIYVDASNSQMFFDLESE